MRAAGRRSTFTSDGKRRTLRLGLGCRFGCGLLPSQELGLSDQRGLVASPRRPASASLHHRGAAGVRDLLRGEEDTA